MMSRVLDWSAGVYSRILLLYPDGLRRAYGAEMALVFAEDLAAARRDSGVRGVIRVWWCAVSEAVRLALPGHLSSPAVRVPLISLVLSVVTLGAEIWLARRHAEFAGVSMPSVLRMIGGALALPSMITPVISLVSVWVCEDDRTILLGLSRNAEER